MEDKQYKKMVLRLYGGVLGTDSADFYLVPVDANEEELNEFAWGEAVNWAAGFGVYPESEKPEDYDEEYDHGDEYSDDISGWFEEYDSDEHDGLRVGGDDSWTYF